jgi:two-component system, LuxR family, sensor kinase FixL
MLYGIALAAVAIALGVRLALATPLGDESPYLFFVPAVLVAAGIAGLGPGLLATVLSTALATIVVRRSHDISAA